MKNKIIFMIIAAVSDIHSPAYYEDFIKSLESFSIKPDLFLLAGDVVMKGSIDEEIKEYKKIVNAFFGKISSPIIACFGNTEFSEYRDVIKEEIKEIRFLDDRGVILNVGNEIVSIFGTTGSLDEPTKWQKENIPNVERLYKSRYELAESFFKRAHGYKILLSHYAPTYQTLEGENPRAYASLGSKYWENLMIKKMVDLVIHGHSHHGSKFAWVESVPVFNVAFPVNKKIVVIDTDKVKPGLQKFV